MWRGILVVRESWETAAGDLAFEYDGDLSALEARLAAAELGSALAGQVLTIATPRGGTINVAAAV
ncbi:hypothetical protein [Arthrobacter sp. AZCC_0090]|uniref:hypothetical protein n=1 Tax=Arthrobacter sp. AZCC_0090 TaxID=2735881 RepID=UPI0016143965|nr:hypothetical protein [Arthrobacter sp. AZCC_0090]MBB6406263.1 hypothetical protein [Arthrobacter sp. AZCC_0090]